MRSVTSPSSTTAEITSTAEYQLLETRRSTCLETMIIKSRRSLGRIPSSPALHPSSRHLPALSFGVAGPGSGVPFHTAQGSPKQSTQKEMVSGPDERPEFHPNKTTLQWFLQDYPTIKIRLRCMSAQYVLERQYFPNKWWHATLNLDTSVFISTFKSLKQAVIELILY